MGVPSFFRWLIRNNKNIIKKSVVGSQKYLMVDCNCLLHPCVAYINKTFTTAETREQVETEIFNRIILYLDDIVVKSKAEKVYIAVDGVVPMGKIMQQRLRRYKNNVQIPKNNIYPIQTLELTVGTDFMVRIHDVLQKYCLEKGYIYSSFYEEGEGEHKILQFLKNVNGENVVIYGLDADLLFLALVRNNNVITIMREEQIINGFDVENISDILYNYVEIGALIEMINNYNISPNEFVVLCFLVGNDFMAGLLGVKIQEGGILKIINAYLKTGEKLIKMDKIDYTVLFKVFKNLEYLNKDCLYKTKFEKREKYYEYYAGSIENVQEMVKNYVETIEWCYTYYFDKCQSYSHCYKYDAPPLICDIIAFYPENIEILENFTMLTPTEQLILTVPKDKYSYVLGKEIIKKLKKIEFEIGYMFPSDFEIDVNLHEIEWKQMPRLPNVDYEYFKQNMDVLKK